jgi:hypothetical protein
MQRWRNPALYFNYVSGDDYWKLRILFGAPPQGGTDPVLGFTKPGIAQETYLHTDAPNVGSRKPIVLYGDSFAACTVPSRDCFEGILDANPESSPKYHLLNYGVWAYGLDQSYILYTRSIKNYEDPVVIFSLLDRDIDRDVLSMREQQKPYFVLKDGQLVLSGLPIEKDPKKFFSERPLGFTCYLFRLALTTILPDYEARISEKKQISEAIFRELSEDLKRRNLRYVVLVFEDLDRTWERPLNWRIKFLTDLFRKYDIPHIWTRRVIEKHISREDFNVRDFVVNAGKDDHPNRAANLLVAERINDWLKTGRADRDDQQD